MCILTMRNGDVENISYVIFHVLVLYLKKANAQIEEHGEAVHKVRYKQI